MALGSFYSWRLDNPRRWEFLVWRLARLTGATVGMQNIAKTLSASCRHFKTYLALQDLRVAFLKANLHARTGWTWALTWTWAARIAANMWRSHP